MSSSTIFNNIEQIRKFLINENRVSFEILAIPSRSFDNYFIYSQNSLVSFGVFVPIEDTDKEYNYYFFVDEIILKGFVEIGTTQALLNILDLLLENDQEIIYYSSNLDKIIISTLKSSFDENYADDHNLDNKINLRFAGLTGHMININTQQKSLITLCSTLDVPKGFQEITYRIEGRNVVLMRVDESWGKDFNQNK